MWKGENAVTKVMKKVDGFRKRWLFVDAKVKSAFLDVPEAPPTKWARWGSEGFEGRRLEKVYERMQQLHDAGVTGQMVARDFARRRIGPPLLHIFESLIPLNPSDDSYPNLGIQERRSRSTIPPIHSFSK